MSLGLIRLVRLRARGAPVAALSVVVGVWESRFRVVCRDHGPDPDPRDRAAGAADPMVNEHLPGPTEFAAGSPDASRTSIRRCGYRG